MEHLQKKRAEVQLGQEGPCVADTAMHAESDRVKESQDSRLGKRFQGQVAKIGMLMTAQQKKVAGWEIPWNKGKKEQFNEVDQRDKQQRQADEWKGFWKAHTMP